VAGRRSNLRNNGFRMDTDPLPQRLSDVLCAGSMTS